MFPAKRPFRALLQKCHFSKNVSREAAFSGAFPKMSFSQKCFPRSGLFGRFSKNVFFPKWSQMVPKWYQMVPNGPKWFQMVPNGPCGPLGALWGPWAPWGASLAFFSPTPVGPCGCLLVLVAPYTMYWPFVMGVDGGPSSYSGYG